MNLSFVAQFAVVGAVLTLVSAASFAQTSTAVTPIPCESTVESWTEKANAVRPTTKTCQLHISTKTAHGDCSKQDTYQCRNQFTGETEWCTSCLAYKTITWKKSVNLICGGYRLFDAVQSCSLKNVSNAKLNEYVEKHNHPVGSIFIESLSIQNFRLLSTDDSRFFFEKMTF